MWYHRMIALVVVSWLSLCSVTFAASSSRCFSETGFCISGDIQQYWEKNGGIRVFGLPISAPTVTTSNGNRITTQQFERAHIEVHPHIAAPYTIQLGLIGVDALARTTGVRMGPSSSQDATDETGRAMARRSDCRWFARTQQYVCGEFYSYWRRYGVQLDQRTAITEAESLALFGLPISPVFQQTINGTPYTVQYFERARFEYHAENPAAYRVQTGLLGREVAVSASSATVVVQPTPTLTLLPMSDLQTYYNNMPPFGYWNSTTEQPVVLAVSELRYVYTIDTFVAPKRTKYVVGLFDIINNRAAGGAAVWSDFTQISLIDFDGNEYMAHKHTRQLNNPMLLRHVNAGERYGGQIAFNIPDNTAVAQVKAYFTDVPPITVELRVWPTLP